MRQTTHAGSSVATMRHFCPLEALTRKPSCYIGQRTPESVDLLSESNQPRQVGRGIPASVEGRQVKGAGRVLWHRTVRTADGG